VKTQQKFFQAYPSMVSQVTVWCMPLVSILPSENSGSGFSNTFFGFRAEKDFELNRRSKSLAHEVALYDSTLPRFQKKKNGLSF